MSDTTSTTRHPSDVWTEFTAVYEVVAKDADKNLNRKNRAAGVRARKNLRRLRSLIKEFCATSIVEDKTTRAERRVRRAAKQQ